MQTDKPGSLSDKFGGFGAAPTDHLWDSIAASLDQKEKKKRGAFWWWSGGIAAGLLTVFAVYQIGYHFGKQDIRDGLSHQFPPGANEDSPELTTKNKNPGGVSDESYVGANLHSPRILTGDKTSDGVLLSENATQIENTNQTGYNSTTHVITVPVEINGTDVNIMPVAGVEKLATMSEPSFDLKSSGIEKRKSTGEWEFSLSAGTLRGYETVNQKLIVNTNNQQQSLADFEAFDVNSITGSGNPPGAFTVSNPFSEVNASIKRPVNIEFNVARTFGRRWSLGSGIGLNYFTGKNTYTTSAGMEVRSNFLSVSVPLTADFDFIKRRRFEVSAGLGVVNEFPFRMIIETTNADPTAAPVLTKEFNRGYMGSALIRTGFSYRLNEHLKVGLSPNIRYYFHQSLESEIPVLKRNLWGGISLGATWSL